MEQIIWNAFSLTHHPNSKYLYDLSAVQNLSSLCLLLASKVDSTGLWWTWRNKRLRSTMLIHHFFSVGKSTGFLFSCTFSMYQSNGIRGNAVVTKWQSRLDKIMKEETTLEMENQAAIMDRRLTRRRMIEKRTSVTIISSVVITTMKVM